MSIWNRIAVICCRIYYGCKYHQTSSTSSSLPNHLSIAGITPRLPIKHWHNNLRFNVFLQHQVTVESSSSSHNNYLALGNHTHLPMFLLQPKHTISPTSLYTYSMQINRSCHQTGLSSWIKQCIFTSSIWRNTEKVEWHNRAHAI